MCTATFGGSENVLYPRGCIYVCVYVKIHLIKTVNFITLKLYLN